MFFIVCVWLYIVFVIETDSMQFAKFLQRRREFLDIYFTKTVRCCHKAISSSVTVTTYRKHLCVVHEYGKRCYPT